MKAQVYAAYSGTLVITVATPRAQPLPSHKFTAAKIHEDFCAKVRVALREHKHVGPTCAEFPERLRLASYFPKHEGMPLYALKELMPAGTPRDVDEGWQMEVMRIRYQFALHLTNAALIADEETAEGVERHLEFAVKSLFEALEIPAVFIPGDEETRQSPDTANPTQRTEIDILVELGPATARTGVEIPAPPRS